MQIPSRRMFIQTHGGVWAITKASVAKQAKWFVPCLILPTHPLSAFQYCSLSCLKAQAQLKADVGLRVAVSQPPPRDRFWQLMVTTLLLLVGDIMGIGIWCMGQLS